MYSENPRVSSPQGRLERFVLNGFNRVFIVKKYTV